MAKSTNILKFISILQFNQMYLIFEINVSKEIKKMIAKDCKRLQKNFNVHQFSVYFVSVSIFKASCNHFMIAIMLFALICAHALTLSSWRSPRLPTPDFAHANHTVTSILPYCCNFSIHNHVRCTFYNSKGTFYCSRFLIDFCQILCNPYRVSRL